MMNLRYLFSTLTIASTLLLVGCGDDGAANPPDAGDTDPGNDAGMCFANATSCVDDMDCCSLNCEANECAEPFTGMPLGASCVSDGTCNSGNCNSGSAICVGPGGECADLTETCEYDWECCTGNCGGGICVGPANICTTDGNMCTFPQECCSGNCGMGGTCMFVLVLSGGTGDPCDDDGDCSSGVCQSDVCIAALCDAPGESCALGGVNADCCSGACSEVSGQCTDVPEPSEDGELCAAHWQCASGLCNPFSGKCEPPIPPPT